MVHVGLPDVLSMKPTELYTHISAGTFDSYTLKAMLDAGLLDPSLFGRVIGLDNSGNLVWLPQGTLGQMPTVEDSAAAMYVNDQIRRYLMAVAGPADVGVGAQSSSTGLQINRIRRTAIVPLTEAGGSIGATTILGATAGYFGVIDRLWIWSPQTDAASSWTLSSTSGVTGIAVVSLQLAANETTEFVAGVPNVGGANCPLVVYGTADNEAITLQAAGLPVVGTTYYAIVEYHLET